MPFLTELERILRLDVLLEASLRLTPPNTMVCDVTGECGGGANMDPWSKRAGQTSQEEVFPGFNPRC